MTDARPWETEYLEPEMQLGPLRQSEFSRVLKEGVKYRQTWEVEVLYVPLDGKVAWYVDDELEGMYSRWSDFYLDYVSRVTPDLWVGREG
jgi:hypothetical protein